MNAPAELPPAMLPVVQRAALALRSAQREAGLVELAGQSAGITLITNKAGYQELHAARMRLKNERVAIEKDGKGAREDAKDFAQAVITEERRLIAIIEPEEKRLQAIQDAEDARVAAEKEAARKAEADRVAKITQRIDWIRGQIVEVAGKPGEEIEAVMATIAGLPLTEDLYAERLQEARNVAAATMAKLAGMAEQAIANAKERARLAEEGKRLAAQQAEQKRQDDERAERQRKEDAERAAARKAEDDARAYVIAWEDAHREDQQRAEDAARAAQRKVEEDARAYALAWDDAHAEEARRTREAEERAAAERRRRERADLEPKADAWACVESIAVLVSEATDADGEPLPEADCVGIVRQICSIIGTTALARDALAAMDRDAQAQEAALRG